MARPLVSPTAPGLATLMGSSCPVARRQPVCTFTPPPQGAHSICSPSSVGIWVGASDALIPEEAGDSMSWNSIKIK